MLRVGLTGGIACGKTAVATMMRELSCHVLEADPIAHRMIEPGQPAYAEVVTEFGREIVAPDGRIDRRKLAGIVFSDPGRLQRLNQIVHPRVAQVLDQELTGLERTDPDGVAVVEAALLIESSYHERLDCLVVVWCEPEQQVARLLARGLTRQQAEQRIGAQMQLDRKRRMAEYEIDCSGPLEMTEREVKNLVARLKQLAAQVRQEP